MKTSSSIFVISTVSNLREAQKISRAVLAARAAACVNFIPKVQSHYWWKGKIEKSQEVMLFMKTRQTSYKKLERLIKKYHSYSIPEIIALPIQQGSAHYLAWIQREVK